MHQFILLKNLKWRINYSLQIFELHKKPENMSQELLHQGIEVEIRKQDCKQKVRCHSNGKQYCICFTGENGEKCESAINIINAHYTELRWNLTLFMPLAFSQQGEYTYLILKSLYLQFSGILGVFVKLLSNIKVAYYRASPSLFNY